MEILSTILSNGLGREGACEFNSNFHQLNLLRSNDIPGMANWLDRKEDKYTSPDIQKEILEIMSQKRLTFADDTQKVQFRGY